MATHAPEFAFVPLKMLRFDVENPRFPTSLNGTDLDEVLKFMLQDAGLIDLMRSIAKQGFFPGEPLLVSPGPDEETWVVVEGNRRLAACTLLCAPELSPTKKSTVSEVASGAPLDKIDPVPCLKFDSRSAILAHLGYRHVTGIKEWDPLAKARFLQQQFELETGTLEDRLRNTARSIGSRSDYVGRLLTAYNLYLLLERSSFYQIRGLSETSINFSLIPSVLAYSNIVQYLGLAGSQDVEMKGLDEPRWQFLSRILFEADSDGKTPLGESRNIRQLASVLADERAREAVESRTLSLQQAQRLLGGKDSSFRILVSHASQDIDLARGEIDDSDMTSDDVEAVALVQNKASELHEIVRGRLDSPA